MQGMLPDSPWYWIVSGPGIHLVHPHFKVSVVEGVDVQVRPGRVVWVLVNAKVSQC